MSAAVEAAHKAHLEVLDIRREECERLRSAMRLASTILHESFARPGREVARAAGKARKVLQEALGPAAKESANGPSKGG